MVGEQEIPTVLVLCYGNVARSAGIEPILTFKAQESGINMRVCSAGIHATNGASMVSYLYDALQDKGYHPEAFRAQMLNPALVNRADLILGFSGSYLDRANRMLKNPPKGELYLIHDYAGINQEMKDPERQIGNYPCTRNLPWFLVRRIGHIDINRADHVRLLYREVVLPQLEKLADGALKEMLNSGFVSRNVD